LQYNIPRRFNLLWFWGKTSTIQTPDKNDKRQENQKYIFNNVLSEELCDVNLKVAAFTELKKLSVFCQDSCYFYINTTQLHFKKFSAVGDKLEINSININSSNIRVKAM